MKRPASARVEVGGRLIEHEDGRPAGQDAGEADALPLAEAEMMRRPAGLTLQVHAPEAILSDLPRLGRREPQVEWPERDVFEDGMAEELIVRVLEHQAHAAPDLRRIPVVDLEAVDPDARAAASCVAAPDRVAVPDRPAPLAR